MRKRIALALFAAITTVTLAQNARDVPKAAFAQTEFNLGKIVKGQVVEQEFVIRNEGTAELHVLSIRMTPPLQITRMPRAIAPGAEAALHLRLDTTKAEFYGPLDLAALVLTDDPIQPEIELSITAKLVSAIELSPIPAFFVAGTKGIPKQAHIEIINHTGQPLRLEKLPHAVERFSTSLETVEDGQRYRLTLALNPNGPLGHSRAEVEIRTSNVSIPLLRIPANTYLHEKVYVFPEQVDIGVLKLRDIQSDPMLLARSAQTLMVYQVGGDNLEIEANTDLPMLSLTAQRGPKGDRYQITAMLLGGKARTGLLRGNIIVRTNDRNIRELIVPVLGAIVE